jgi:hypothetical protein
MYVMGHSPGQSAQSWRRQFYTDLGHGMKILDLYSFKVKPDTAVHVCALSATPQIFCLLL